MLPITHEWVSKAEGDYDVIVLLQRSRKASRYDPICFHAQQCVEKYLKACLTERGTAFPKTHDLPLLLSRVAPADSKWSVLGPALTALSAFGVLPRYPGMTATNIHARASVATCRRVRTAARRQLGL